APDLDETAALGLLRHGELELEGLLAEASNATLRAMISHDGVTARCIYKPVRGERPLWDFPDGTLAGRELAAYLVSAAGGWGVVPPTVLRDGPLGLGMCQLWIDDAHLPDAEQVVGFVPADAVPDGWLAVADARDPEGDPYLLAHADDPRLSTVAVFDMVVNNADRKGGHLLTSGAGRIYAVDHGVCFHTEDKLRTVLWGWADRPLSGDAVERLRRFSALFTGDDGLPATLSEHLARREINAIAARVRRLIAEPRYRLPSHDWPALPWPPI
ncbi:MAG: SCO1664 family protein, partial [Micromonosporaceae bacterium]